MSGVIAIDATQLRQAAPRVADIYATLLQVGRCLETLGTGGVPAPYAARVSAALHDSARALRRAAGGLEGTAQDLLRRAGLATAADQIATLSMAASAPDLTASLIARAHELGGYPVGESAAGVASRVGRGAGMFGLALGVGVPTLHDLRNPYLDEDRKVADGLARVVTAGGVLVAGGVIVGMASGGLLPVGIAVGAGLAFGVLDRELGITDAVADGIDWATDQTSAAADAIGEGIDDAVDTIGGLFG